MLQLNRKTYLWYVILIAIQLTNNHSIINYIYLSYTKIVLEIKESESLFYNYSKE